MAHVTLGEAARQTGRSKSQISRAIRAGQLSAERSAETASFRIEQSELQRWLDATDVIRATVLAGVVENPATGAQHAALEAQVERFKEAADLLRSQLADALSERDEWREAFKQQRALPPPQPARDPPSWWRWLALTTLLLAIMITALAISFALAERPASFGEALVDTVDRLAEPAPRYFAASALSSHATAARSVVVAVARVLEHAPAALGQAQDVDQHAPADRLSFNRLVRAPVLVLSLQKPSSKPIRRLRSAAFARTKRRNGERRAMAQGAAACGRRPQTYLKLG